MKDEELAVLKNEFVKRGLEPTDLKLAGKVALIGRRDIRAHGGETQYDYI
jgi:hypothetical protein